MGFEVPGRQAAFVMKGDFDDLCPKIIRTSPASGSDKLLTAIDVILTSLQKLPVPDRSVKKRRCDMACSVVFRSVRTSAHG
jgi:hypothetical protein